MIFLVHIEPAMLFFSRGVTRFYWVISHQLEFSNCHGFNLFFKNLTLFGMRLCFFHPPHKIMATSLSSSKSKESNPKAKVSVRVFKRIVRFNDVFFRREIFRNKALLQENNFTSHGNCLSRSSYLKVVHSKLFPNQ